MSENKLEITLMPWQDEFIFGDAKYHFLKSSWGTGKSLALILAAMNESQTIQNNLGVIFRKEFVDLRDSTIKDFQTYTQLNVNSQRDVVLPNKSVIMFRHLEELNNIQNLNLGWFGFEQGEELETDLEFYTLFGRLRRFGCSLKSYVIANARGHNWIYKIKNEGIYIKGVRQDKHLSATTLENVKNLPQEYIDNLEILKVKKPSLYNRFVLNSDDEEDVQDQIMQREWVEGCIEKPLNAALLRSVVVCDPARYGDDRTVIYALKGNKIVDKEIFGYKDTMYTAGRMILMANRHAIKNLGCDTIGVGGGVADRLKELSSQGKSFKVFEINSATKSSNPEKWRNLRSQMWAEASDKFYNRTVCMAKDMDLIEELCLVKYKAIESNGRLQVEGKEEIKKRLGKSPDLADALVMGLYLVDRVPLTHYVEEFQHKFQRGRFRGNR